MQINTAISIPLAVSVFYIPHDGAANFGHLNPDLVRPTRNRLHQKQVPPFQVAKEFVIQIRFFGIFGSIANLIQSFGDVAFLVFDDVMG